MKYLLLFILFSNYSDSFCQNDSLPLILKPNTAFVVYPESSIDSLDKKRALTSYSKSHPMTGNEVNIVLYDNSTFEMNFSTDIPNFEIYSGQYEMSSDTLILNISFSISESETCKKRYFKIGVDKLTSLTFQKKKLLSCSNEIRQLQVSEEVFIRKHL